MVLSTEVYKKVLVDSAGLVDEKKFNEIIDIAKQNRRPLEQTIMEQTFTTRTRLLQLFSDYFNVPYTELKFRDINPKALQTITEKYASDHMIIPFDINDKTLKVALANPSNSEAAGELNKLGHQIELYVASEESIKRALALYEADSFKPIEEIVSHLRKDEITNNEETVVHILQAVLNAALISDASDVHIEPFETELLLRFRIDGYLSTVASLPLKVHGPLTSLIKVRANMRVDQKRLPQDGRFNFSIKGQETNIRVSSVPSIFGEKIVLRVLPKDTHLYDMVNLGLLEKDLEIIRRYLSQPHGFALVCGSTGAGKTTSLYAFVQEIGTDKIDAVNISTIEDPIEYTIPRVTQIQTNAAIDLTFAAGLRALLRQDPDIIMVGEIRDRETADFAVRSALVGRLVLSSLHTNDAVGAIPRLLDMGVEPYLVSSTLGLVVSQRLVRRLCNYCRVTDKPSPELIEILKNNYDVDRALTTLKTYNSVAKDIKNIEDIRIYRGAGCDRCDNTGYKGRVGLFEILVVSDKIRKAINDREDSSVLRKIALQEGMKTLFEDGLIKVVKGDIDLAELPKATYR